MACSSIAIAAPTPQQLEQIQREQTQIIQEEQFRRKELLKEQDLRRKLPTTIDIEKLGPVTGESAQCFDIDTIVLEGSHSLTDEERRQLTQPFIGKCIGLVEIKELMRVITNYYIDKGYVTTRAYIPQQDLSTGTLKLLIIEGITRNIDLDDPESRVSLATAFPGLEGRLLDIRDIEQGLDQINRLQSNNATMELLPAKEPGKTDILIKNQQGSQWSGGLALDNYGSASTGEHKATLTAGWDNPLGINDFWFMSLSRNTNTDTKNRLSKSAMLTFNIPYGYWNVTGSYSESRYKSLIESLTEEYRSSGVTYTTNLGLQRVLKRGKDYKLTLSMGMTHKNSRNFIEDSLLVSGSRKLTVLDVNLAAVFDAFGGLWSLEGGVSHGIGALGVEELPGAGHGTVPVSKYWKANAAATYTRPFKLRDMNAAWSSSVQAQYSDDYLHGSEQISVGGLYTVRGYDGTSLSGDRGFYWRNDVTLTLPPLSDANMARWVGGLKAYVAVDAGHIYSREGQTGGTLVGGSVGLRSSGGRINFDIAFGRPLDYSSRVRRDYDPENHAFYFKMSIPL